MVARFTALKLLLMPPRVEKVTVAPSALMAFFFKDMRVDCSIKNRVGDERTGLTPSTYEA